MFVQAGWIKCFNGPSNRTFGHIDSTLSKEYRSWRGKMGRTPGQLKRALSMTLSRDPDARIRHPRRDLSIVRAMSSQRRCETHADRVDSRFTITRRGIMVPFRFLFATL